MHKKGEIQSILIPKNKYSLRDSINFIKNNFMLKKVDYNENNEYYRFRQQDPDKYKYFRTIPLNGHKELAEIKLIIGYI